jgi:hypothetical protein
MIKDTEERELEKELERIEREKRKDNLRRKIGREMTRIRS